MAGRLSLRTGAAGALPLRGKEWRWSPDRQLDARHGCLSGGVQWRARTLAEGDRRARRFRAAGAGPDGAARATSRPGV